MITPISKPIRRTLTIDGTTYVVTLDTDYLKLIKKGHRHGRALRWSDLLKDGVPSTDTRNLAESADADSEDAENTESA